MILKEKNNDVALRSLSEIFVDVLAQAQTGNFGFVFSSSFTINPGVEFASGNRLIDVFRKLPNTTGTLFLLPPPVRFSGNYRAKHARNALELLGTGVLVWFDRFVHSKFLLFWSFNHARFVEHRRYYGSTNFTKGGLITNIEEFYYNRRGWRYTVNPPINHVFYLDVALKRIEEITSLYESPEYWARNLGDLQNKIPRIISELKEKASTAKGLLERLKVSMLSYSHMLDILSDLWNLPGKRFAYSTCEKLLRAVDDYSGFNLEFLEELTCWADKSIIEFIDEWGIDQNIYLDIPKRVIEIMPILEGDIEEYRKKGYGAYIYHEEKELMERLKNKQWRGTLSTLRRLMRSKGD